MNAVSTSEFQPAPGDASSDYFTFVDPSLPAMRGWWSGGTTAGVFAGHVGFFGLHLCRTREGYLEWPRAPRRERQWMRYVREDVTCAGFVLWLDDGRTPATRLVARWADAQTLTVQNDWGGSGVMRAQSEDLIDAALRGTKTGLTLR